MIVGVEGEPSAACNGFSGVSMMASHVASHHNLCDVLENHLRLQTELNTLSYLKDSKCNKAFKRILTTCVHLQEHAARLLQERLEACEYFKENEYRTSLVKQLLFLLEKLEIHPCRSTPISQEILLDRHEDTIISDDSNVGNENVSDSIDGMCNRLMDKSVSTEDESDFKDKSHEKCGKILTNTFLENTELIEKLADNINKEVSSKSNSRVGQYNIESIVQGQKLDPILYNFLMN
ncbi:hypothetical protein FQR65_LT18718 [Abscondita terminalis]|nr:hypothetical protein FQR65_LT18718 [Abscondita terminalis]